ncbi:hypothetical protein DFJ73DRAFT_914064 [Zopfochytrium polystomum]|nr:hypothetical protein DFJ73DRAFT_914064 [Zopfochytrium polystomum]
MSDHRAPSASAAAVVARQRLELRYSERALRCASHAGRIDILRWWWDSGLTLLYDESALTNASAMQWWKDSGYELRYSDVHIAVENGVVQSLRWWRSSGLRVNWDPYSFVFARYQESALHDGQTTTTKRALLRTIEICACAPSAQGRFVLEAV